MENAACSRLPHSVASTRTLCMAIVSSRSRLDRANIGDGADDEGHYAPLPLMTRRLYVEVCVSGYTALFDVASLSLSPLGLEDTFSCRLSKYRAYRYTSTSI